MKDVTSSDSEIPILAEESYAGSKHDGYLSLGDREDALKRRQQSRGLAERDGFDKCNSRADHKLKPGDGTLPGNNPHEQTADANNYGASQAPQEEFINQSN